jgi:hypothetical protein
VCDALGTSALLLLKRDGSIAWLMIDRPPGRGTAESQAIPRKALSNEQ